MSTCPCWRVVFPDGHEFCCADQADAERNARIYRGDDAVVVPPRDLSQTCTAFDAPPEERASLPTAQSASDDVGPAADAPGPYPSSALPSDGA